jgi:hypothetical protein
MTMYMVEIKHYTILIYIFSFPKMKDRLEKHEFLVCVQALLFTEYSLHYFMFRLLMVLKRAEIYNLLWFSRLICTKLYQVIVIAVVYKNE